ncbi:DUF3558 domain-containing protein [Amycolatopsis arida]|uniref:DUF3558 domain-containing protein n=1 Tax=Amycolatopsis arida TaxID=587909 RepID=UPI001FB98D8C|nr:DUF3558 domain-containing protein [Amycolatopsis arida]
MTTASRRQIAGVVLTACTVISACSPTENGSAVPIPIEHSTTAPGNDVFAGLNACRVIDDLLDDQGFNPGENKTARNECVASKLEYGGIGLALDSTQGIAELAKRSPDAVELKINGRKALQTPTNIGTGCAVALEVDQHARAMVTVSPVGSSDLDACAEARRYAEELEPKLPEAR